MKVGFRRLLKFGAFGEGITKCKNRFKRFTDKVTYHFSKSMKFIIWSMIYAEVTCSDGYLVLSRSKVPQYLIERGEILYNTIDPTSSITSRTRKLRSHFTNIPTGAVQWSRVAGRCSIYGSMGDDLNPCKSSSC